MILFQPDETEARRSMVVWWAIVFALSLMIYSGAGAAARTLGWHFENGDGTLPLGRAAV